MTKPICTACNGPGSTTRPDRPSRMRIFNQLAHTVVRIPDSKFVASGGFKQKHENRSKGVP